MNLDQPSLLGLLPSLLTTLLSAPQNAQAHPHPGALALPGMLCPLSAHSFLSLRLQLNFHLGGVILVIQSEAEPQTPQLLCPSKHFLQPPVVLVISLVFDVSSLSTSTNGP